MTKPSDTSIALLNQKVDYVVEAVKDIKEKLEGDYVTKESFTPVKNIVYGMVSVIMLAVLSALVALVIIK